MDAASLPPTPPRVDEFRRFGPPAGERSCRVEISGVAVELSGLTEEIAEAVRTRYGPYASDATGAGRPLRVEVVTAPVEYFVPPGFARRVEVYRMGAALEDGIFRTVSYRLASWIDVTARTGQVALGSGALDPVPRALENFLRSSVAWLAFEQGGFFLHGASIVRGGAAYLFYGPSGAGKSTLAAQSRDGRVISDDLTLVLGDGAGLAAAGGPFRGTYTQGEPLVGRFPVAGLYRLRKDVRTRVAADDGRCFADLLGNLPFVVDQMPRRPTIIDRIRERVSGVRFAYLHFRRDEDFWPAIDAHLPKSRPTK